MAHNEPGAALPTEIAPISAIITAYNYGRYLGQAISSVLAQSCAPFEIVVVDDGSTDDTRKVAEGFGGRVRYYYQQNGGIGAARNRGVDESVGTFLAFLDADDLWVADKLERQLAAFEADPRLNAVFGHARQFYSPELTAEERQLVRCPPGVQPAHLPGAMLVKRQAFLRVGAFATDRKMAEAFDWYMRAADAGLRMLMQPDLVLLRRLHRTNHGTVQRESRQDYVRVIKAALDRRRAARTDPRSGI